MNIIKASKYNAKILSASALLLAVASLIFTPLTVSAHEHEDHHGRQTANYGHHGHRIGHVNQQHHWHKKAHNRYNRHNRRHHSYKHYVRNEYYYPRPRYIDRDDYIIIEHNDYYPRSYRLLDRLGFSLGLYGDDFDIILHD